MTLSNVSTANSTNSSTITVPSGGSAPAAGDLIIFAEIKITPGPPTMVLPTGFTQIASLSSEVGATDAGGIIAYKIAAGNEGGTSITGMAANIGQIKLLSIFHSSSGPITALTVNDLETTITLSDPTAQVINASGQTTPLIALALFASDVHTRTFSPAQDGECHNTAFWSAYLYWKMYDSSPADITADMNDGGTNLLFTTYLKLTVGSAVANTFDVGTGAFALTGNAQSLSLGRGTGTGDFVVAGGVTSRSKDISFLGTGSFALAGGDISKSVGRSTATGALALTGGTTGKSVGVGTGGTAFVASGGLTLRLLDKFYPDPVLADPHDPASLAKERQTTAGLARLRLVNGRLTLTRVQHAGLSIKRKV